MLWLLPVGEQETARHTPWVTWTLVAVNVLAFVAMMLSSSTTEEWWALYALTPSDPHAWQFVTANFVHADVVHLVGNMLFLVLFGDNVEDVFGPVGFIALYFIGGLLGDLTLIASNPDLAIPSAGASGCIAALAGAYAVMFYNRAVDLEVMFLVFPIYSIGVPALLLLAFYFGYDLWLTGSGGGTLAGSGGVNYVAHGVGFAIGLLAGAFAFGSGAVARMRKHQQGHALFGYLPWNVGRRERWR